MRRWPVGAAEIEDMLERGSLERVRPNTFHADHLLSQAALDLTTSQAMAQTNPTRAYEALYECLRGSVGGLLAVQGLRVTRDGGHVAYVEVLRHQTGQDDDADFFHEMRQRRNELQYPTESTMSVVADEVLERVTRVSDIAAKIRQLLESSGIGQF
ncbi:MAG: hypothetical protein QM621_04500 [Aeromicrobium sp.]|uniref:hypothetical protein n=1 Tax=Aeromicrobium sp. TaxID=1871063 RepID=UPI0039E4FE5C